MASVVGLVLWPVAPSAAVSGSHQAVAKRPITALRATRGPIRWKRVRRARYYEVVLWQAHGRVADVWTSRHRLSVRWLRRALAPRALAPGRYLWFVYPGFGPRSAHSYGRLSARGILNLKG